MKIATPRCHGLALTLFMCTCARTQQPAASTAAIDACKDAQTWQDDLQIVLSKALLGVEGVYIRNTCDGTTQVAGTQLLIYRPKGSPSAALTRILRCGGARVLLVRGKHFSTPDRPFLLPDGWLDISVKSRDRNILVTLSADSVPKNIELLRRAAAIVRTPGAMGDD